MTMRMIALMLLAGMVAAPAVARPKLPPCGPKLPQLFIAPMGQPFRAGAEEADPMGRWFAQVDTDGDGRITPAEFAADAERFFRTLDRDGDGELIPSEVIAYEQTVPEIRLYAPRGAVPFGRPSKRDRKKAQEYGAPLGAGRWSFLNIPEPVSAADADLNRGVTAAEFRAAALERFARIDAGNRGFLDLAGLPKTPAQAAATDCDPTRPPPPPRKPR